MKADDDDRKMTVQLRHERVKGDHVIYQIRVGKSVKLGLRAQLPRQSMIRLTKRIVHVEYIVAPSRKGQSRSAVVQLARAPGAWLEQTANRVLTERSRRVLLDDLADMREEVFAELAAGHHRRAKYVEYRAYFAIFGRRIPGSWLTALIRALRSRIG